MIACWTAGKMMDEEDGLTKRDFLQAVGAAGPTLRLLLGGAAAGMGAAAAATKFTPTDCAALFTASHEDLKRLMKRPANLTKEISGRQSFRGIPFLLGPDDTRQKRYVVLSTRPNTSVTGQIELPVQSKASFVCLAQFCDWDENETPAPGTDAIEKVGQHMADLVMVFDDGTEQKHPIRRRFEVNSASVFWGHLCFAAVPHRQDVPSKLTDPLSNARDWGDLQLGVWDSNYAGQIVWLAAIPNPSPERALKMVRVEARADDPLAICGVTLFHGHESPLQYDRLKLYRITLPHAADEKRWDVAVDLGVVARKYQLPPFDSEPWLASPGVGLGESGRHAAGSLYVEVSASPDATLTLRDRKAERQYEFDLRDAMAGQEVGARSPGARIQFLEREKAWLRGRVIDAVDHRPTPVRIAFRSSEGRYLAPYGHRTEINTGWFQDYGADLKVGESSFAYVDGTFQIELPVGDVYVEITKGFEYERIRKKLTIRADQGDLDLEISRFANFRTRGWVSADSHVHFLSPSTAILEGQAEGLNLINLLAAQWGDLFTNVGDLSHGPLKSSDGEMMVQVGTENRNHILGHLGLLGGTGAPVYPMSAAGPEESYIGDPLWTSLADWADRCRKREGLVMAVHFPYPTAELAADIVLGKIDAVEVRPDAKEAFNGLRFLDWYHYLNCGYRLPAFGGTDKMSANVPAGGMRGYAWLGDDEFTFANWAKAVRRGNTFMTSGPLLLFQADGHAPGEEIRLGAGGGKIEVRAEAKSTVPIHRVEIVWNGKVVATREESGGAREMTLREPIHVSGPGWLAARCISKIPYAECRVAAHTSPVYVVVPGEDLFSGPAAAYMLTLIDGAELWARNVATRTSPDRLDRVLHVFTSARERLHQRLHEHGIAH